MQVIRSSSSLAAPMSGQTEYVSQMMAESLIGVSRWSETARQLVEIHAAHDNALILEGERGVGKKLIARLVHRLSWRQEGPFVSLSLGCVTDETARGVLFGGTRKSSGDDDVTGEKGVAELARGGTLYIDGISAMSPALTDDIARFADRQAGASEDERPVRILFGWACQFGPCVASAGVDPRSAGLGYEIIQIPPLRERPEDIEALAEHFIRERSSQTARETPRISPDAMRALRGYDWPRNVRELKSVINQMMKQLSPPAIDVSLLPSYLAGSRAETKVLPAAGLDLDDEVKRVEVDLICAALRQSRGLQNRAAQLLRIKPTTLFMKIRRHGIDVEAFR